MLSLNSNLTSHHNNIVKTVSATPETRRKSYNNNAESACMATSFELSGTPAAAADFASADALRGI